MLVVRGWTWGRGLGGAAGEERILLFLPSLPTVFGRGYGKHTLEDQDGGLCVWVGGPAGMWP